MPTVRFLVCVFLLAALHAKAAAGLWPLDVAAFAVEPNAPAMLRWRVEQGEKLVPLSCTIRDYGGGRVVSVGAEESGGVIEARLKFPRGYFDIELAATKQRFGVVSLPACTGTPDPFFCIDSAMSWLVHDDGVREGLVKVLRRSGIAMSRERLGWGAVQPANGRWDWQARNRYEKLRKAYAAHRVPVLEMFHDAPAWMGRVGKYPADLQAAARAWGMIAKRWRPTWGALEVWNEPDIFFGDNLPADQYVPLVKTIAYALSEAKVDTELVGPVVAHFNRPWLDSAARNGLLDVVDVASFHTYARAEQMEGLVAKYRDWLCRHGKSGMRLWITECGRPWQKGPPRPPAEKDAASALDIAMKAVEARACGIDRYFAFVYPYYEERTSNFGMMGRAGTPLRCFAAYANLARVLRGLRYAGDLACGDQAVRRARVFRTRGATVAALYTGRVDPKATIRLGAMPKRIEGIDGRPLALTADGAIPVPDGLTFVWLASGAVPGLRTDTPAKRLVDRATGTPISGDIFACPSPVVLRYEFDAQRVRAGSDGYRLKGPAPEKLPLVVRAFNLSGEPLDLALEAACEPAVARILAQPGREMNVPARGHTDVTWQVDLRDAFAAGNHARVTVRARAAKGSPADTLSLDFSGEATLQQMLKAFPRRTRLPIGELKRWRANAAPDATMAMEATGKDLWRLDVQFGGGDPWVYPYFALPEGISLAGKKGLLLRARCVGAAAVRVFCWEGTGGVGYITGGEAIPADGEWHAALIRFEDLTLSGANAPDNNGRLDLEEVRRLSIGLNSKAGRNTLEVSDLYVVGGK